MLSVMGMLMGVNIQTPDNFNAGAPAPPPPKKEPEPEPEPEVELTAEQKERLARKSEADKHKEQGNAAYKGKRFDEAIGVRSATRRAHAESPC